MDDSGSFVRWQANTNTQLGYVIGLILSLTTASLGFAVTLFGSLLNPLQRVAAFFVALSIIVLIISGGLAVACTINRLCDFRKTTEIARDREKLRNQDIAEAEIKNRFTNGEWKPRN